LIHFLCHSCRNYFRFPKWGSLNSIAVRIRVNLHSPLTIKGIVSRYWDCLLRFARIELKFKEFRITFIFNLKVVFTMKFFKMAPILLRFSPVLLQEQDFPGRSLLQRASRTPEELLSGVLFPRRRLQRP
jgi:hypothetical protein